MARLSASGILRPVRRLWQDLSPPALLVLSFGTLVLLGTAGMLLIPGLHAGAPLGFVDALFTMTSAVCVTGLVVVDTATAFTRWGQVWLLLFIQLGGIGLLTLTTLVIGAIGGRLSVRNEVLVAGPMDYTHRRNVVGLALAVGRFTLVVEAAGAAVLWLFWLPTLGAKEAAWHAVFHAISAFCNAGFSTFSDSLIGDVRHPVVLLLVSLLVILGGLGYLSGEEAVRWWRARGGKVKVRMSAHTYAVMLVTGILLVLGALLYGVFEWTGVLAELPWYHRLTNAWFMSVTARTAGFNSVDYSAITNSSAFLTIILMTIGAAPGSTAGGLKVTTVAILVALALTRMRGRRHVEIHDRTVPKGTIDRTVSVALLFFGVMTVAVFLMSLSETRGLPVEVSRGEFLPIFFEVVSAFCTVGLSMGVTGELSPFGKLLTTLLMFVGRMGPLAFFAALALRSGGPRRMVRSAEEDLIVG